MAQGVTGYFDLQDNSYGATLRVHYSETYETATNTSSVTITKLEVSQSAYYGVTHYFHGTITINGSTAVTLSNNGLYVGAKNTFYQIPDASGSVSVAHNSDGSKSTSISVSAKAYNGSSQLKWSVSGSKTVALTTIPRASSLEVSNGTLGVEQTLKVTRASTSFSHTITYKCGVASGTICEKSTSESIKFTPPIDLAAQNTTGTTMTITYTGNTAVGSVAVPVTLTIPASVKPGCNLSFMDETGYADRFGGYVQGQSKLLIALVGEPAYGSPIASYKTTISGTTYTKQKFTTDVLSKSGEQTISATVTDKRERTSDPETATIDVLPYSPPRITAFSVHRCNEDGTENNTGSFAKVTYSFEITSLSNKNTKTATLRYKKSADSQYVPVVLDSAYSVKDGVYIFAADDGSSYDIYLEVADTFTSSQRGTSVSTADVIMHFRADGKGMGLGKVSEKSNTLDMGWDIELNGKDLTKNGQPSGRIYGSIKAIGITSFPTTMQAVANAMPTNSSLVLDSRLIVAGGEQEISDLGISNAGMYMIFRGNSNARVTLLHIYGATGATTCYMNYGCYSATNNAVIWLRINDYPYLNTNGFTLSAGASKKFRIDSNILLYGRVNLGVSAMAVYGIGAYSHIRAPIIAELSKGSNITVSSGGDNSNGWYIEVTNTSQGSASFFTVGSAVPVYI